MLAAGQRVDPDDVIILNGNNGVLGTGTGGATFVEGADHAEHISHSSEG